VVYTPMKVFDHTKVVIQYLNVGESIVMNKIKIKIVVKNQFVFNVRYGLVDVVLVMLCLFLHR